MTSKFDFHGDPDIDKLIVDGNKKISERSIEVGYIGKIVGSSSEKPGNIAAISIIASFLIIVGLIFFKKDAFDAEVFLAILSIITLALGYLFGHGSSKKDGS